MSPLAADQVGSAVSQVHSDNRCLVDHQYHTEGHLQCPLLCQKTTRTRCSGTYVLFQHSGPGAVVRTCYSSTQVVQAEGDLVLGQSGIETGYSKIPNQSIR